MEFEFVEHGGPSTRTATCHRIGERLGGSTLIWHLELGVGLTVCCEESSRCFTGLPVRNDLNSLPVCPEVRAEDKGEGSGLNLATDT